MSIFGFGKAVTVESAPATEEQKNSNFTTYEETLKELTNRTCLISLGGQGAHIALEIFKHQFAFTQVLVFNTDKKDNSLIREAEKNREAIVYEVGKDTYEISGTGAGGDPKLAEENFALIEEEVQTKLKQYVEENKMKVAFITLGLGGGTGTGLITPILKLCREAGIQRSYVLATMPSLSYEKAYKVELAKAKLEEIQTLCDGIMLVNNEWIYRSLGATAYGKTNLSEPLQDAYDRINARIANVLAAFIEIMVSRAKQNIDLNDLLNFIQADENKVARLFFIGKGIAKGERRIIEAADKALDSIYLVGHGDLKGATETIPYVVTPQGTKGPTIGEQQELNHYILRKTRTEIRRTIPSGGPAEYKSEDPDFQDEDALMLVLLITGFNKTPLEAFCEDYEWEKEICKKEFEAFLAETETTTDTGAPSTPSEESKSATTKEPTTDSHKKTPLFILPEYGGESVETKSKPVQVAAEGFRTQSSEKVSKMFPEGYLAAYDAQKRLEAIEQAKREKEEEKKKEQEAQESAQTETKKDEELKKKNRYNELLNS